MAQGYQRHEGAEVALPMLILLTPDPEANEEQWERRELAARERQYRKAMATHADDQERSGRVGFELGRRYSAPRATATKYRGVRAVASIRPGRPRQLV